MQSLKRRCSNSTRLFTNLSIFKALPSSKNQRPLVLFAFLFLGVTHLQAQRVDDLIYDRDDPIRPLVIGAKAGASWNQFSQPGSLMAGNAGAFVRVRLLPFLQIQGDLLYDISGGGRGDLDRDLALFTDRFGSTLYDGPISHLRYLNREVYIHSVKVPLTVRLGIPELIESPIQPRFVVGGSYSYILMATEMRDQYFRFDDGSRIILSDRSENVSSDYFDYNIAIHGGFEMDFNLTNDEVFTIGFIYSQGITDLNNIQFGQPENIERLRTRSFSINFSYSIF